jgi:hypothetical protein
MHNEGVFPGAVLIGDHFTSYVNEALGAAFVVAKEPAHERAHAMNTLHADGAMAERIGQVLARVMKHCFQASGGGARV